MLKRREKIIEHLIYSDKGVTGTVLSNRLSVSVRTIRNDISLINSDFKKHEVSIKADKTNGYYISKKDKQVFSVELAKLNNDNTNTLPTTPSERQIFIALKLLKEENYISMESLSEMLFVSKTTICNDTKKLVETAEACKNLKVKIVISTTKGICLKGLESQKRFFIFQIIESFYCYNLHVFKNILKHIDININFDNNFFAIHNAYILYLDAHNIALADNDLNTLVLETLVSLHRVISGNTVETDYESISKVVLGNFIDEIAILKGVGLSQNEKLFFGDCLALKRVLIIDNDANDIIREDAKYIVKCFIDEIHKQFQINLLVTDTFVKNFSIHISSMINRIKVRSYDDPSTAKEIRATYPFAFELATNIMPIIERATTVVINETELSYIAVYIAVVLEQMKNKKNIVVICGSGLGVAQLIINRLETFFYNDINIMGYYPIYQIDKVLLERGDEIDLILTTIPAMIKTNIDVIKISTLLTQEDINKLSNILHSKKNIIRNKNEVTYSSFSVFDKSLFKIYKDNVSNMCILNDLTDLLIASKYIQHKDVFISSVLQREAMYSTKYGDVWLPHPMESISSDTTTAIAIVNTKKVKCVVFLLAINSKQYDKFRFLYDKIINFINDKEKLDSLLKVNNFDEFMCEIDKQD